MHIVEKLFLLCFVASVAIYTNMPRKEILYFFFVGIGWVLITGIHSNSNKFKK